MLRRTSTTQRRRIAELSYVLFGDAERVQVPETADAASDRIVALNEFDTLEIRRLTAEARWARWVSNGAHPRGEEFALMSTSNASWVERAAEDLGLTASEPCGHCDGTGTVKATPTKTAVSVALIGYQQSSAAIAKRLTNPTLDDLRSLADKLGGVSLDDAAAWCERLAKDITAA